MKKLTVGIATLILATSASVYAVTQQTTATDHNRLNSILNDNGFTHVTEIEWESSDRIEIEGFTDDGWFVEQRFSSNNEIERDEREKLVTPAWGLEPAQVQNILERGIAEGMVRFDELEVNSRGQIELEGYNNNGREIEIKLMLSEL